MNQVQHISAPSRTHCPPHAPGVKRLRCHITYNPCPLLQDKQNFPNLLVYILSHNPTVDLCPIVPVNPFQLPTSPSSKKPRQSLLKCPPPHLKTSPLLPSRFSYWHAQHHSSARIRVANLHSINFKTKRKTILTNNPCAGKTSPIPSTESRKTGSAPLVG